MLSLPIFRNAIVASDDSTFSLVTQNVDELSRRALRTVQSRLRSQEGTPNLGGSTINNDPSPTELLEIHGSLFDLLCTSGSCRTVEKNYNSPICPALKGTEEIYESNAKLPEPDIPIEDLPRCRVCGSLARPGVVWFGESVPQVYLMHKIAMEADLCIVVGTSSEVSCILTPTRNLMTPCGQYGRSTRLLVLLRSCGKPAERSLFSILIVPRVMRMQTFSSWGHVRRRCPLPSV